MVLYACVDHIARGASSDRKNVRTTHHTKIWVLTWNHIDGARLVQFDVSLAIQLLFQLLVSIFRVKIELITERNRRLLILSIFDKGSSVCRISSLFLFIMHQILWCLLFILIMQFATIDQLLHSRLSDSLTLELS